MKSFRPNRDGRNTAFINQALNYNKLDRRVSLVGEQLGKAPETSSSIDIRGLQAKIIQNIQRIKTANPGLAQTHAGLLQELSGEYKQYSDLHEAQTKKYQTYAKDTSKITDPQIALTEMEKEVNMLSEKRRSLEKRFGDLDKRTSNDAINIAPTVSPQSKPTA